MRAQRARTHESDRHAEHAPAYAYERRRPEESVLYRLVSEYWPLFRERVEELGNLPKFVVNEVDEYLRCGLLEYGFMMFSPVRTLSLDTATNRSNGDQQLLKVTR